MAPGKEAPECGNAPGISMPGPRATSLLGFMSLIGLLRAIEASSNGGHRGAADKGGTGMRQQPRLSWDDGLVPRLHVDVGGGYGDAVVRDMIASWAAQGIELIGKKMKFPGPNVGVEIGEFAMWQRDMDHEAVMSIGSDACTKRNDRNKADSTPLCMMYGSGHQKFLDRLERATTVDDGNRVSVRMEIDRAMFFKWTYTDTLPKIAFRWDPTEYHPHALQAVSPAQDDIRTVNGANRLAAVGLAAFVCCPGRAGRLETVGCLPRRKRLVDVLWPVWRDPLSLAAIRAAMGMREIMEVGRLVAGDAIVNAGGAAPAPASAAAAHAPAASAATSVSRALSRLRARGITGIMRTTLFWDGKYKSVRTAELVA